MEKQEAVILLKNISKTYGKKKAQTTVLKNVSLEIFQGETIAVVGKSGSGKSTLMHLMSSLDRADGDGVTLCGQEVAHLKQKKLDALRADNIGFIFQGFFVQANETCFNNVALALEIAGVNGQKRQKMILGALEQVGLLEKKSEKAGNLSGGQKQRLAIARAIVNRPKVLFADEPTGNLDSVTGEKIVELLFSLNKQNGTTLIIVTHDEELAGICERQYKVVDGQIINEVKK